MMPDTLPGFLLLSGLLMFLFSLFKGSIKYKDINIPSASTTTRVIIGALGIIFMCLSGAIYINYMQPSYMQPSQYYPIDELPQFQMIDPDPDY